MAAYNFTLAEEILVQQIAKLTKKKQPTIQEEAMLEMARKSQIRLRATEQVVIIDSLILPKDQVLKQIKLSHDGGSVMSCAEFFSTKDNSGCTLFRNELCNHIVYAEANKDGHPRLKE